MALTQLPSEPNILQVEADFPFATPSTLFDYWTMPALLQQWWPPEAEIVPQAGGTYHLSWPRMNWHLHGHYTSFDPGQQLSFTWKWDPGTQDIGEREVKIIFEPAATGGTRLLLTHTPTHPI